MLKVPCVQCSKNPGVFEVQALVATELFLVQGLLCDNVKHQAQHLLPVQAWHLCCMGVGEAKATFSHCAQDAAMRGLDFRRLPLFFALDQHFSHQHLIICAERARTKGNRLVSEYEFGPTGRLVLFVETMINVCKSHFHLPCLKFILWADTSILQGLDPRGEL